jgi:hypothetical protein
MHFCIESMWSHNKAWNHGMWNSTATTKDHQVHHGAAVLQIVTPSYSTLFLRVPSIITQSTTLQCLLLDCSSNKSSKNRWKWPPWLYKWCHKLTPTNVTGMRVAHDMAGQRHTIARVTSANMTHSTKILVVNLMESIPTAIWCWAWGGKRSTLQQWWFWFVPWQLQ